MSVLITIFSGVFRRGSAQATIFSGVFRRGSAQATIFSGVFRRGSAQVKVLLATAVAAAALLTTAGCGAAAVAEAPKAAVADTFAFGGKTLDGQAYDAAALAGRPALLWFWAPWCATCASEAQSVNDLRTEYGDKLAILGIAGMGGNADMHKFVADLEVKNVNLDDQAGVLWKRFGITEQSTYVLVDRSGQVRTTSYLDDLELTDKIKALVA
jgi:thiol-disulfide isomerase/thioredoxin